MEVVRSIEYEVNTSLRDHEMVRLRRLPPRAQIVCLAGRLWVTLDRDRQDHILLAGEGYSPPRGARGAIIYAMESSEFVVRKGEPFVILLTRLLRTRLALRP